MMASKKVCIQSCMSYIKALTKASNMYLGTITRHCQTLVSKFPNS